MSRQRRRSWFALALATLLSSGVLATGVVLAFATPAQAASLGTITITPTNGTIDASPMFASATSERACPATFGENAGLRVGPVGGPYQNLGRPLGGGGYDQAPVTIAPNRSLSQALGAPPTETTYLIIMECFSLTAGRHVDEFQLPILICDGTTWTTAASCGTAEPTTTTVTAEPSGAVPEGTPITLTATIDPPSAAGPVQFRRKRAGTTVVENIGDPVAVGADGKATLPNAEAHLPVIGASSTTYLVSAAFTPTDSNAFLASTSADVEIVLFPGDERPTTTALTVTPENQAPSGSEVALSASVIFTSTVEKPTGGTIEFRYKPDTAGSATTVIDTVPLTDGTAEATVSGLADGLYTFEAGFTPAEGKRTRSARPSE
ncbi:hypothetical protein ACFQ1L_11430 [Phytohabitans flavus]|uniref:hypothetical protein n=1 Tax=Phytohabitans flavus TaxID=1076124 RepID=UPI00363098C0